MRKKIILLCFMLLLLVGCKKIDDNNDNYVQLILDCLSDKRVTNHVAKGYQYYVPKGVRELHDYDYNQVFLIDKNYVYLYVDIISYFFERELSYNFSNEDYYRTFEYDNEKGYITLDEKDDGTYFLSIVYRYAKVEAYVKKDDLSKVVTLSSIILNSIDYNDVVIEKILEGDFGQFSEFTYEVDKPEGASSNFSQILEESVQKEEEEETKQLPGE